MTHTAPPLRYVQPRHAYVRAELVRPRLMWSPPLRDVIDVVTPITLKRILAAVSRASGRSIAEITSAGRSRYLMWPRMVYYALAKELTTQSFFQIGSACGGRDHSTVLHGVKNVAAHPDWFAPLMAVTRSILNSDPARNPPDAYAGQEAAGRRSVTIPAEVSP